MRLYLVQGCPFAHRASIVLREKELAFEACFFERGKRPPELERAGPHARSPTLFDDEIVVWDAQVVLEYLEERYPRPRLLPEPVPARAEMRMLAVSVAQEIMAPVGAIAGELNYKPTSDPAAIEQAKQRFLSALPAWDARLKGRSYLAGDALSLADVVLYTPFPSMESMTGIGIPKELANLRAWFERMARRPSTAPLKSPSA